MSRWQFSDWTLGLLAALGVLAAWEGYMIGNCPANHGCGGCFSQFYAAGTIIRQGEVERLYDQPYFRSLQAAIREDPLRSLYPPTLGLLVAPLTVLSYRGALTAWWAIEALAIVATGILFYRTVPRPRAWRIRMLLALTALAPIWIAVALAQLAPILLLVVAAGLTLHRRGRRLLAGVLLSLLALKPQLAAGLVLWMVLRRDGRTLAGLAAGLAAQVALVAGILGPGVWRDYLHALPEISAVTRYYHYSPLVEASFVGIARNLCAAAGMAAWEPVAMKITYAITAGTAAVLLWRVVSARRPLPGIPGTPASAVVGAPTEAENYEYVCGVLFMLIFPPYLIIYDQTLIAIPLVLLWSSPAWRWGVALLAATTALAVNLSLPLGFAISGFVSLAAMFCPARFDFAQARPTVNLNPSARWR